MSTSLCKKLLLSCLAIGLIFALTAPVLAQNDTLEVNYFANMNSGFKKDATVRITNPGSNHEQNMCANIYVFSPDQQLNECCSCFLSPDGLRTLSVTKDLTSNPLTGRKPTTGAIKIISSVAGACNAAAVTPAPELRSWATHIQSANGTATQVTETESLAADLSGEELAAVTANCAFIQNQGSGSGICTCGTGD